jgi:hypothetical protein
VVTFRASVTIEAISDEGVTLLPDRTRPATFGTRGEALNNAPTERDLLTAHERRSRVIAQLHVEAYRTRG